eukprot:Sspe_Gene.99988::Locus_74320_Transcript_1_1_Confidence_1.000_Length_1688::g.99988::m.99988
MGVEGAGVWGGHEGAHLMPLPVIEMTPPSDEEERQARRAVGREGGKHIPGLLFRSTVQTAVDVGCGVVILACAAVAMFSEWGTARGRLLPDAVSSPDPTTRKLAVLTAAALFQLLVGGLAVGLLGVLGAFVPYHFLSRLHYWVTAPIAAVVVLCAVTVALFAVEAKVGMVFAVVGLAVSFAWCVVHHLLEVTSMNTVSGLTSLSTEHTLLRRPSHLNVLDISMGVVSASCGGVALATAWYTKVTAPDLVGAGPLGRCAVAGVVGMVAMGVYVALIGVVGSFGGYRPLAPHCYRCVLPVGICAALSLVFAVLAVARGCTPGDTSRIGVGGVCAILSPALALVWCPVHLVLETLAGNSFHGLVPSHGCEGDPPRRAAVVDAVGGMAVVLLCTMALRMDWVRLADTNQQLPIGVLFFDSSFAGLYQWEYVAAAAAGIAFLACGALYAMALGLLGAATPCRPLAVLYCRSAVPLGLLALFSLTTTALLALQLRTADVTVQVGMASAFSAPLAASLWVVLCLRAAHQQPS